MLGPRGQNHENQTYQKQSKEGGKNIDEQQHQQKSSYSQQAKEVGQATGKKPYPANLSGEKKKRRNAPSHGEIRPSMSD